MSEKTSLHSFHSSGTLLALVSPDNRIYIWDVLTSTIKFEYASKNHLIEKITSLSWGFCTAGGKRSREGKTAAKDICLAFGTSTGSVYVLSVPRAEIVNTFSSMHPDAVSSIEFEHDSPTAYSLGVSGSVCHWNAATGKTLSSSKVDSTNMSALALSSSSEQIALASSNIKLSPKADLAAVSQSFTGHVSPVSRLRFSPSAGHLLSMASQDRSISVWDTASGARVAGLSMTSVPVSFDVIRSPVEGDNAPIHVATITETGEVHVFNVALSGKESGGKPKRATINPAATFDFRDQSNQLNQSAKRHTSTDSRIPVLAVCFAQEGRRLLLARGSINRIVFEEIQYVTSDNKFIPSGSFMRMPTVLDGASTAPRVVQSVSVDGDKKAVKVIDATFVSVARPSAQERLDTRSLSERIKEVQMVEAAMPAGSQPLVMPEGGAGGRGASKSHSLAVVLSQALHSQDQQQLAFVFEQTSQQLVENTIRKLPTSHILLLIKALVERFQNKPTRGQKLIIWLRATLVIHSSYLMTVPDLVTRLGPLYALVDSRLSSFKRLLRLSGRLDLIVSQIAQASQDHDEDAFSSSATFTLNESDDDGDISEEDLTESVLRGEDDEENDDDLDIVDNTLREGIDYDPADYDDDTQMDDDEFDM
ncbi:hypothetical protein H696_00706 [Fonticula alba]|uniref:Small-subunit processome Utp12 domain-containing protein n=1 Tax=Fonticula alba TaxID=691883 RepID=A0A058ZGV0_FONAL|nr:hypothetical protein H696_00706 [Fonticula alba]KCV73163.1 hypothetical protein H696_00706 [Fonticula alba]|eukprot:XP_009492864.1 hypothetical protein H696_00706 [Fonticula alba]